MMMNGKRIANNRLETTHREDLRRKRGRKMLFMLSGIRKTYLYHNQSIYEPRIARKENAEFGLKFWKIGY